MIETLHLLEDTRNERLRGMLFSLLHVQLRKELILRELFRIETLETLQLGAHLSEILLHIMRDTMTELSAKALQKSSSLLCEAAVPNEKKLGACVVEELGIHNRRPSAPLEDLLESLRETSLYHEAN